MSRLNKALATLLALVSLWSCWMGEGTLGPERSVVQLTLVPVPAGPAAVGMADVVTLEIVVTRADGRVVVEQTEEVTSNVVDVPVTVTLEGPTEVLNVEVGLRDSGGGLLYTGQLEVVVDDDDAGEPITIPILYVGPGSDAQAIEIDPPAATVVVGGSPTFTVRAFGSLSETVLADTVFISHLDTVVVGPDTTLVVLTDTLTRVDTVRVAEVTLTPPVRWESLDESVASVDERTGLAEALRPGTATIVATTVPLGVDGAGGQLADTAQLTVLPQPSLSIDDVSLIKRDTGTTNAVDDGVP